MEKRFSMTWFTRLLGAATCAILAACSSAPTGKSTANTPSTSTAPTTQAPSANTPLTTPGDAHGSSSIFEGFGLRRDAPGGPPGLGLTPLQTGEAGSGAVAFLTPPRDLWERIRRGFAMPDLQSDVVHDREQWYATRPDYIFRMTERSRKYLFYVVEELERRNMPSELALLPFIESAFNPQAVSTAKAAGMWQFMPATGKEYDLKQNAFRDDRRDVLASTRAALDYLQMLYGMFNDWHLALAAYNWGQGSVKKAIERNQKKGLGTSYEELNMPMETRMYVPKLQAVKNIVAHPDTYNSTLPVIENHPFFDTVSIDRDIDVPLAAKLAEVDEADFRALNPSINRPVIFAAGTPQILLPWDNAAIFQRNLLYHVGPLASWTAWAVPSHMRPADIAKRVGMSERELRDLNRIPPSMLVRAGSTLLIPRDEKQHEEVSVSLADHGLLQLQPEVVLHKGSVKARKGDTIHSLAQRLRLNPNDVAQWNQLKPTSPLKVGQVLVVFQATTQKKTATTSGSAHAHQRGHASREVSPRASHTAAPKNSRKPVTPSRSSTKAPKRARH
jgi:membrane-bound lytic murein transglycosylase D